MPFDPVRDAVSSSSSGSSAITTNHPNAVSSSSLAFLLSPTKEHAGFFDDEEEQDIQEDVVVVVEEDPTQDIHAPDEKNNPSLVQLQSNVTIKRLLPYNPNPHTRVNGPPPASLYIPYTPEEYAFYSDPKNSRNPLRGSSNNTRKLRRIVADVDVEETHDHPVPEDIDICPKYANPRYPLHPSLVPDLIRYTPKAKPQPSHNNNNNSSNKRKRGNGQPEESTQVAAHYNKRLNISREERVYSPIIGLKSFNNWVKTVLINKFARYIPPDESGKNTSKPDRRRQPPLKVLDLGCGKGGDLMKWQKAGLLEYIGIDIAEVSITQARGRWKDLRSGPRFDAAFYVLDAYEEKLQDHLPYTTLNQPKFDTVSMQFCMHYAWKEEGKARRMLENVSGFLRTGGTFLGTIPDSEQLLNNLRDLPPDAHPLAYGNSVYTITFDERGGVHEDGTETNFPPFGQRYTFFLQDAVEDVPEYVVQWEAFELLAAEYGLKLIYHATFHQLFNQEREVDEFAQLLTRMKVINQEGESELTAEQWEAANIYVAFAFVKVE